MTTMDQIDQTLGADVYAGRVARTLNSGFIAMMISVGHRTSLFDTLAALPPSTSQQVAAAAGLSERYVREWLAAMTSARIIDYDARTATYFLSIEYAAVLARGAGANNLAPAAQLLSLLASSEDLVVAGFYGGGGVMPEAYERVNEVLAAERRQLIDESFVEALLELMPGMRARLEHGATVLDAGCGDGRLLVTMARMFPHSLFRGYDLSRTGVRRAQEAIAEAVLGNLDIQIGDVASLDEPHAYDLVLALGTMAEQAFPRVVLRNLCKALKRDGRFLMQEVAASSQLARNLEHPFAPMLYAISCMHAVPLAAAQDGEALGTMWGQERAMQMLVESGFTSIRFETLAMDALSYYCISSVR